jgi:hypothetical protein
MHHLVVGTNNSKGVMTHHGDKERWRIHRRRLEGRRLQRGRRLEGWRRRIERRLEGRLEEEVRRAADLLGPRRLNDESFGLRKTSLQVRARFSDAPSFFSLSKCSA